MEAKLQNYFETSKREFWSVLSDRDRKKVIAEAMRFEEKVRADEEFLIPVLDIMADMADSFDDKVINKRFISKIADRVAEELPGVMFYSLSEDTCGRKYSRFSELTIYKAGGISKNTNSIKIWGIGYNWIAENGRVIAEKLKENIQKLRADAVERCRAYRVAAANLPEAFAFRRAQEKRLEEMTEHLGLSLRFVLDTSRAI